MAGRPSPQNPSISRLTSPPETILSCYPENPPSKFQPYSGRHQGRTGLVKTVLACKSKCIDYQFFGLRRRIVMTVIKLQQRRKRVDVQYFELVG
jgi:hypothetical protein